MVDLGSLRSTLAGASLPWLLVGVAAAFLSQFGCIVRWRLLVPKHPSLNLLFLTNSSFVGSFFNTFLPTTVGGDVMRSYDLIKATGAWRESLASVLIDRLIGLVGLLLFASVAWLAFQPARTDPVLSNGFLGFCLLVLVTFAVLGSRRVLHAFLRPFGKIGLGTLQAHAKQFQETLRTYLHDPKTLLEALGITLVLQVVAIGMFAAVAQALQLSIPPLFFAFIVPILMTVSQLPISLNGWGVREGAAILLFGRIGIEPAQALSLSFVSAAIPLLSGGVGGILFLLRKRRRRR